MTSNRKINFKMVLLYLHIYSCIFYILVWIWNLSIKTIDYTKGVKLISIL